MDEYFQTREEMLELSEKVRDMGEMTFADEQHQKIHDDVVWEMDEQIQPMLDALTDSYLDMHSQIETALYFDLLHSPITHLTFTCDAVEEPHEKLVPANVPPTLHPPSEFDACASEIDVRLSLRKTLDEEVMELKYDPESDLELTDVAENIKFFFQDSFLRYSAWIPIFKENLEKFKYAAAVNPTSLFSERENEVGFQCVVFEENNPASLDGESLEKMYCEVYLDVRLDKTKLFNFLP